MEKPSRSVRSYMIRTSRMTDHQKAWYARLFPVYGVTLPAGGDLVLPVLFPGLSRYFVEIGFGMGVETASIAVEHPDNAYLGIEVHLPGIGKLLGEIERLGLKNLRILEADAMDVFETAIAERSLDGIHVFFPDPWQKRRHHKRRLLQPEFCRRLATALKPGGYLYVATDWKEYADTILAALDAESLLSNPYDGYAPRQAWRPETKFERRGLENQREIFELFFVRK